MAMFVDPSSRVPVTLGENTIFIRAKMSVETRAAVQDEVRSRGAASEDGSEIRGFGSYRMALLLHNIVGWEGPDFEHVPCSRANIRRLDGSEPLVEKVLDEIGTRNAPPESPDPNSLTTSGSTNDGELRLQDE